MYVKELDNIDELFTDKTNLPGIVKRFVYIIKKILCILTITEEKICILPYKNDNRFITKLIIKIISRTTKRVVLSNYLNQKEDINLKLKENNVHVHNGNVLSNYLIYNFISYIAKMRNEDTHMQEVYILINKPNALDESNIIYFAKNFKRINIVTNHIKHFRRLENYLEEKFGIAITITNNKRKSLAKAGIIINLDFDEELINSYNINTQAIILNPNKKIEIYSKLFNGINISDYQIIYSNKFSNSVYKKFDKKLLYETVLIDKNYEQAMKQIKEDNVKIVNLIGKNGIINRQEYNK